MAAVSVNRLSKSYPYAGDDSRSRLQVIEGLDLDIPSGQFVSFFGPNGCGKTTFLSLVAGLTAPDDGIIRIDNMSPREAKSGLIFQNYRDSLFPWLRNDENVAFPLKLHGVSRNERRRLAGAHLQHLGIDVPFDGYPSRLSGGQQQLIAIARALILDVDVLLMDEPFGSLDYTTRFLLRDVVQEIWSRLQTTVLFVSHSVDEAIYLADRLILFSRRPLRIIDDIEVRLDRPRKPSTLEGGKFFRIQSHVLRLFQKEVGTEIVS